ncbi:MAG: M61 family metallopeptidase [Bacteroidia bacterium]
MHYIISYKNPQTRYIRIEAIAQHITTEVVRIQLPAWRPGRYELGNFAKNLRDFRAYDVVGKELRFQKITKDCWEIETAGSSELRISYEYYAADLNAGSTFLDESQVYMNPVNCLVYMPDRMDEKCTVEVQIPQSWKIACALDQPEKNVLVAENFDRLADSPFIASPSLKHNFFVLDGVEFHLWFQGECKLDWSKLISDFFIFVSEQMVIFGQFPAERYHFLFQILPQRFYHGVEHVDSTVIALGPPYRLMRELYNDLLGVSCHELFHAWNIKTIRPAEMFPYDLTKENYSRLGFVCEGVTTYYGDYLLYRSGVWKAEEFWPEFEERIQKHFDSHARNFLSVADASVDTWVDGYVPGAPHRKTSIYHEGSLLAFATDIFIRKHSDNVRSLDTVMRRLYDEFACKGKGYTESDYKRLVEETAGADFSEIWNTYIFKATDYTPLLNESLAYIGYELTEMPARRAQEVFYGFKTIEQGYGCKVSEMYYDSPAEEAGLALGDEIMAVNGMVIQNDLHEWLLYFTDQMEVELTLNAAGIQKKIMLKRGLERWFKLYRVVEMSQISMAQHQNRASWSGKKC